MKMTTFAYKFSGEVVPKKNGRIMVRQGKRVMNITSEEFRAWHGNARIEIMKQQLPKEPIITPVRIAVYFYHTDYKRRDSDNQLSSVLDLLVDCGVLHDDCWNIVRNINIFNYKNKDAYCEVFIFCDCDISVK